MKTNIMQTGLIAVLGLLLLAPMVISASATPIVATAGVPTPGGSAYMVWPQTQIVPATTNTVYIGTTVGTSCPFGYTWGGTITVTTPNGGVSTFKTPNNLEPCGLGLTEIYTTSFTGAASTAGVGVYKATFVGATRAGQLGVGMSWTLTDYFEVVLGIPTPLGQV